MPILTICFDLMILETITNEKKGSIKLRQKTTLFSYRLSKLIDS